MIRSNVQTAALLAVLLVGLAGCSAPAPKASPTPTQTPTQTQAEIEIEFYKVAADSCAKAQKENTVERFINDEPSRIIALAKDNAYLDYSAIYIDNMGEPKVLYELELTACSPGYLISMMEEANKPNEDDYEHYVKKNSDGSFTWTQSAYSEEGPALADTIYEVQDGFFVKAIPENVKNTRVLEYGPISDEDMQALKDAVDAELERLAE